MIKILIVFPIQNASGYTKLNLQPKPGCNQEKKLNFSTDKNFRVFYILPRVIHEIKKQYGKKIFKLLKIAEFFYISWTNLRFSCTRIFKNLLKDL